MLRFTRLSAPLVAVALATAGCETGSGGQPVVDGRVVGGALGAVAGGLAGTQVGQGRGRTAAIIGGTILGGVIGSAIAAQLSPQGKEVAYATTQQAMNTAPPNQPVQWRDPVNPQIYGTVTPTSPAYYVQVPADPYMGPVQTQPGYAPPPGYRPPQAYATSSGIECRDYQTAVFSGGQPETLTGRMCRRGPGEPWRPANDGYAGI